MAPKPPDLSSLIDLVLQERAQAVAFTREEIDAEAQKLRVRFDRIRENIVSRKRIATALEQLPPTRRAGWLEGVQAAVKVVLGEVRRSSQILVEAANGLLPPTTEAWAFMPAATGATRG